MADGECEYILFGGRAIFKAKHGAPGSGRIETPGEEEVAVGESLFFFRRKIEVTSE